MCDMCLCDSGDIKDEAHLLLKCPKTDDLRLQYDIHHNVISIMKDPNVVEFIYECLKKYEN